MQKYLTDYSVSHGDMVVKRWRELGEYLICKYNDGYIKNDKGRPREEGYSDEWYHRTIKDRPDQFKLPLNTSDNPESILVD